MPLLSRKAPPIWFGIVPPNVRAGCKRACFWGGPYSNREIAVGQLWTRRIQFFGGEGGNASIAAVSRNHVLAVVKPKLFVWLHLAVDKASVLSPGGFVLTVGRIDYLFCTAVETKFGGFPKQSWMTKALTICDPARKTPTPPSRKNTVIPRFFHSCPALFAWLCLPGSVHRCLKEQMEKPENKNVDGLRTCD